jgi:hypothetical protein
VNEFIWPVSRSTIGSGGWFPASRVKCQPASQSFYLVGTPPARPLLFQSAAAAASCERLTQEIHFCANSTGAGAAGIGFMAIPLRSHLILPAARDSLRRARSLCLCKFILKGGAQSACLHNKEPAPQNVSCAALGISISDAARRIRVLNSTPSLYW